MTSISNSNVGGLIAYSSACQKLEIVAVGAYVDAIVGLAVETLAAVDVGAYVEVVANVEVGVSVDVEASVEVEAAVEVGSSTLTMKLQKPAMIAPVTSA